MIYIKEAGKLNYVPGSNKDSQVIWLVFEALLVIKSKPKPKAKGHVQGRHGARTEILSESAFGKKGYLYFLPRLPL